MTAPYAELADSGISWIGLIPKGWKVKKFRHLFRESPEKIEGEVRGQMLSVSGYRGVEVKVYDDENRKRLDEDLIGYRIVRPGQLVVNTMWLNYAGLGVSNFGGYVSPAYRAYNFVDDGTDLNPRFAHYLLRCSSYVQGYTQLLTGIRPNSLQMSRNDLMAFPVLIPPLSDQTLITAFIDRESATIDVLIEEQKRLIDLLKEKRQAVISNAVTKGLNPHAPMKESGIEWLGKVPEHWDVKALKHLTSHVVDCLHTTPHYDGETLYPAIRTADIERGRLLLEQARLVSEEVYQERIQRLRPRAGDILYSREGERFGMAALTPDGVDLCLGQRMMMFRIRPTNCSAFIMWALNSDFFYQKVLASAAGATSPHANIGELVNFPMVCPSYAEQRQIAEYLSTETSKIDRLIDTAADAVDLLQERRAALISAAVTGKIDVRTTEANSEAA